MRMPSVAKSILSREFFPTGEVNWRTYPDFVGHKNGLNASAVTMAKTSARWQKLDQSQRLQTVSPHIHAGKRRLTEEAKRRRLRILPHRLGVFRTLLRHVSYGWPQK